MFLQQEMLYSRFKRAGIQKIYQKYVKVGFQ